MSEQVARVRVVAVLAGYWTGVLAVYMRMQARAHGPANEGAKE